MLKKIIIILGIIGFLMSFGMFLPLPFIGTEIFPYAIVIGFALMTLVVPALLIISMHLKPRKNRTYNRPTKFGLLVLGSGVLLYFFGWFTAQGLEGIGILLICLFLVATGTISIIIGMLKK